MKEQRTWLKTRRKRRLRILAVMFSVCMLFMVCPDIFTSFSVLAAPASDWGGTGLEAASGYTITESDLAQMKLTGSYVEKKELYLDSGQNAVCIREVPEIPHTVTYNYSKNGGASATKTSDTVMEGTQIDLSVTATFSGWEFVGWNTDKDAHEGLTALTMGTSDVTLYAIYKKEATVYFYSGSVGEYETLTATLYNNNKNMTVTYPEIKELNVSRRDG